MKQLISILLFATILNNSYANSTKSDWVLKQYEKKIASKAEGDAIESYQESQIDGEQYLVIMVQRTSDNKDEYNPGMFVFKKAQTDYLVIAYADLQGRQLSDYNFEIKDNSIFLGYGYGHHGVFDERYQFKLVDEKFRMIGADFQSASLGCYADVSPSDNCDAYEVWSGSSYNFLNSTTICWEERYFISNEKKLDENMLRYRNWLQPKNGRRHEMKFPKFKLALLDGFNYEKFTLPLSCQFDQKNRLRKFKPGA